MFEMVAGLFALGVAAQVLFWVVASVLFPVFWAWMLIDSALRAEDEYPTRGVNEKIIWLVAMFFLQPVAVLYFFLVYRKVRRAVPAAAPCAAPAVPGAA